MTLPYFGFGQQVNQDSNGSLTNRQFHKKFGYIINGRIKGKNWGSIASQDSLVVYRNVGKKTFKNVQIICHFNEGKVDNILFLDNGDTSEWATYSSDSTYIITTWNKDNTLKYSYTVAIDSSISVIYGDNNQVKMSFSYFHYPVEYSILREFRDFDSTHTQNLFSYGIYVVRDKKVSIPHVYEYKNYHSHFVITAYHHGENIGWVSYDMNGRIIKTWIQGLELNKALSHEDKEKILCDYINQELDKLDLDKLKKDRLKDFRFNL